MLNSVLRCGRYAICLVAFTFGPGAAFAQTPAARQGAGAMKDSDAGEIHGIARGADRQPVPDVRVLVHSVNGSRDRTVSERRRRSPFPFSI